ncbi:uncharacterized protein VTP21DRAFT_813 [Calcarisporiella thermophila]|uniref:uncharacterized protein n=1 Tax=Calcarisporiella thermophila TaxID=911321 RepID=UPI0037425F31
MERPKRRIEAVNYSDKPQWRRKSDPSNPPPLSQKKSPAPTNVRELRVRPPAKRDEKESPKERERKEPLKGRRVHGDVQKFFWAIERKDSKSVRHFLQSHPRFNVNQLWDSTIFDTHFTWGPLHAAAFEGSIRVIRVLMEFGAEVDLRDTWYGGTPLAWAAYAGHFDAARLLIQSGADRNAKNDHGQIPADLISEPDDPRWEGILTRLDLASEEESESEDDSSDEQTPEVTSVQNTATPTPTPTSTSAPTQKITLPRFPEIEPDSDDEWEEHEKLQRNGIEYGVGDFVYICSPEDAGNQVIALIEELMTDQNGKQYFKGTWFIRPDQIPYITEQHPRHPREVLKQVGPRTHTFAHLAPSSKKCYVMHIIDYAKSKPDGFSPEHVYFCGASWCEETRMLQPIKAWKRGAYVPEATFPVSLVPRMERGRDGKRRKSDGILEIEGALAQWLDGKQNVRLGPDDTKTKKKKGNKQEQPMDYVMDAMDARSPLGARGRVRGPRDRFGEMVMNVEARGAFNAVDFGEANSLASLKLGKDFKMLCEIAIETDDRYLAMSLDTRVYSAYTLSIGAGAHAICIVPLLAPVLGRYRDKIAMTVVQDGRRVHAVGQGPWGRISRLGRGGGEESPEKVESVEGKDERGKRGEGVEPNGMTATPLAGNEVFGEMFLFSVPPIGVSTVEIWVSAPLGSDALSQASNLPGYVAGMVTQRYCLFVYR